MKANEAPEKIYVNITHPISDKYTEMVAFEHGNGVEYTQTDAFIEKACKFLKDRGNEYIAIVDGQLVLRKSMVKHFKEYMKGE